MDIYIYIWIQTLSEKVLKLLSLQIIVDYTPVPLPKKVLGSIGIDGDDRWCDYICCPKDLSLVGVD